MGELEVVGGRVVVVVLGELAEQLLRVVELLALLLAEYGLHVLIQELGCGVRVEQLLLKQQSERVSRVS